MMMRGRAEILCYSLVKVLIIFGVCSQQATSGAICSCSNSFRFDQLCPDPRVGPPSSMPTYSSYTPATTIQLNSYTRRGSYGQDGYGSNGGTYAAVLTKDPSTSACDFFMKEVETAVVTAIHVTENPWDFKEASSCTNTVKFKYDVFQGFQSSGGGYSRQSSSTRGGNSKGEAYSARNMKGRICEKQIGIRRPIVNGDVANPTHEDFGHDKEELEKKMHVYFWHNFTLHSYSAEFNDTITNHNLSKDEISCTDSESGQYVQIAIIVWKNKKCETIVQQYKIDRDRSPHGCNTNPTIPFSMQFCGSYDCLKNNAILTSLKLLTRRSFGYDEGYFEPEGHVPKMKGPAAHYDPHKKSADHDDDDDDDGISTPTTTPPANGPKSKAKTKEPLKGDDAEKEEEEEVSKPFDWNEAIFVSAFPLGGIFLIVIVLYVLRVNSAKEICRGYPYQYPRQPSVNVGIGVYQGSCNSINKNTLPM